MFVKKTPKTAKDYEHTHWGSALCTIIQTIHSSPDNEVSQEVVDQLWQFYCMLVSLIDSQEAKKISFDNVIAMFNYFIGVISLQIASTSRF